MNSSVTLCFGAYCNSVGSTRYFFNGYIDEVAIYDSALSEEAVKNSYCAIEALVGSDLTTDGCL